MSKQWEEATGALTQLAYIDEADSYEVDQAGIYFDPATREFVLVTASGCSCWEGDCDVERFPTMDALEVALINDTREYNPTLKGAQELIADAHEAFEKEKP